MWIVILMYALFASVFTAGKVTLQYVDPFFLTGVRMLIAGGLVLIYLTLNPPPKFIFAKGTSLIFFCFLLSMFSLQTLSNFGDFNTWRPPKPR